MSISLKGICQVYKYFLTNIKIEVVKKPGYLDAEWPNNNDFKKKIVEETRLHLDLHIEFEKLNANYYRTPMDLIK